MCIRSVNIKATWKRDYTTASQFKGREVPDMFLRRERNSNPHRNKAEQRSGWNILRIKKWMRCLFRVWGEHWSTKWMINRRKGLWSLNHDTYKHSHTHRLVQACDSWAGLDNSKRERERFFFDKKAYTERLNTVISPQCQNKGPSRKWRQSFLRNRAIKKRQICIDIHPEWYWDKLCNRVGQEVIQGSSWHGPGPMWEISVQVDETARWWT